MPSRIDGRGGRVAFRPMRRVDSACGRLINPLKQTGKMPSPPRRFGLLFASMTRTSPACAWSPHGRVSIRRSNCNGASFGYELVYETYSRLNAAKSNAILVLPRAVRPSPCRRSLRADDRTASAGGTTSSAQPSSRYRPVLHRRRPKQPGWLPWFLARPRPNPATGNPGVRKKPLVAVVDWVLPSRLADLLGIDGWAAVIGGSLGGMQACAGPSPTPSGFAQPSSPLRQKLSAENIAFQRVAQAILTDRTYAAATTNTRLKPVRGHCVSPHAGPHHLPVRRPDGGTLRPQAAQRCALPKHV